MPHKSLIRKFFQSYWRLSRSLSLDVRACVRDAQGKIGLVRSSNDGSWQMPGGIVETGETSAEALARILEQIAGIEILGEPRLVAIYTRPEGADYDQRALFLVPSWRRAREPNMVKMYDGAAPAAHALTFFDLDGLPHDVDKAVPQRLAEIDQSRALSEVW
ncbi:MAG: NUDIX domain-containing protein [Hyphomicrobiaceae bacterium]|nr:NUDIX domain-containing protein [Hyphomicrobiaceae bacterium]